MDRRTLLRAAVAGAFVGGLAGCGISSHDGIVVDAQVSPDSFGGSSGTPSSPPPRRAATDPTQLVANFLCQPAGDDGPDGAKTRIGNYLDQEGRDNWTAGNDVTVVWFDPKTLRKVQSGSSFIVTVELHPLGVLKDGRIQSATATARKTVNFKVTPGDGGPTDLYISHVSWSGSMLLSSAALATYYDYRNLYYWASNVDHLVPDPRYIYTASQNPQARRMIEMLLAPPSPWLQDIVQGVGDNVKVKDNPVIDRGKIAVNLSQQAGEHDLRKLVAQLTWTLQSEVRLITSDDVSPIQLKIESALKEQGGEYKHYNVATLRSADPKAIYVIADGRIRRLGSGADLGLPDKDNQNVHSAACIAGERNSERPAAVAVVRAEADGHQLRVYPATDSSGSARTIKFDKLGKGLQMLRPVFVDADNLLVVTNGVLHHVRRTGGAPKEIEISGFNGKIRAFALSPEGRRLAIVTKQGLFVAALSRGSTFSIPRAPERVPTVLTELSGVGFSGDSWLVVSGMLGTDMRIMEISIDGALIGRRDSQAWLNNDNETGLPNPTSLVAYPDNPDPRYASVNVQVVFTANGEAYQTPDVELVKQLNPKPENKPINPFFLE
ncbi:MAG: hypothetical protein HOV79_34400 [Hamadaea sp.]|nr:hypothetical protein [Hamadaea sp.]